MVLGVRNAFSRLNWLAAMSIRGRVPRAKPRAISAPKRGDPESKATHRMM